MYRQNHEGTNEEPIYTGNIVYNCVLQVVKLPCAVYYLIYFPHLAFLSSAIRPVLFIPKSLPKIV